MIYFAYKFHFFPWAYYVCLLPCFSGVFAYQVHGFFSQGIGLSVPLVVDSFHLFICGVEFFVSFCVVTLARVLAAILHIIRYCVGSHVGMRLRVAHCCLMLFYSSPCLFAGNIS